MHDVISQRIYKMKVYKVKAINSKKTMLKIEEKAFLENKSKT